MDKTNKDGLTKYSIVIDEIDIEKKISQMGLHQFLVKAQQKNKLESAYFLLCFVQLKQDSTDKPRTMLYAIRDVFLLETGAFSINGGALTQKVIQLINNYPNNKTTQLFMSNSQVELENIIKQLYDLMMGNFAKDYSEILKIGQHKCSIEAQTPRLSGCGTKYKAYNGAESAIRLLEQAGFLFQEKSQVTYYQSDATRLRTTGLDIEGNEKSSSSQSCWGALMKRLCG